MKTSDKLRFVKQNMAKNKSRIFMTILATAMGCTFLMMIASVAFGLQRSLVDDMMQGQTLTEIQIHGKKNGDSHEAITQADADRFKKRDGVKAVTAQRFTQGEVTLEGYKSSPSAIVTNFEEETKAGLQLSEGRMPKNGTEAIVGYHFAQQLMKAGTEDAYTGSLLGKQIEFRATGYNPATEKEESLGMVKLTIVGLTTKPDKEWLQSTELYLDDSIQDRLFHKDFETHPNVKVYAESADQVTAMSKALRDEGYSLYSVADTIKEMDLVFLIMKIGLIFVGTIAVLIASIGIYNTMTMAVTERSQDIGIMKAIGANPKTIRSIFLLESFGIGLFGALIGLAAAYGLSAVINAVVPIIIESALDGEAPEGFTFTYIPFSLTLVSVGISLGVAVLSGMRPAARATRIDVLRALRRDI
ncbi:ABC transporter permease [Paenibacillus spongiae]|uniref:ABC transporter permease n=1 Tax=Paenibacillus spongiae TaxID=2909671 RepID=A0ABY5SG51_9BACL|nr:FtsX-like permease family protein [Paenibacillus spongiae]UVI31653.1 ABC transporter permease [Paenibacillus spongiae]